MAHEFETLNQAARALLIETCGLLNEKRLGYVVAGGWVPVLRGIGASVAASISVFSQFCERYVEGLTPRQDDGSFDEILQFADIPGPFPSCVQCIDTLSGICQHSRLTHGLEMADWPN